MQGNLEAQNIFLISHLFVFAALSDGLNGVTFEQKECHLILTAPDLRILVETVVSNSVCWLKCGFFVLPNFYKLP
jgi:hypothetical protein